MARVRRRSRWAGGSGAKSTSSALPSQQRRGRQQDAEVEWHAVDSVEGVADPDRGVVHRANRERALDRRQEQAVAVGPQLLGGQAEGLEQPVGHGDARAADLERGSPVELADDAGEVALDGLAPVAALRRQLAEGRVEVAVDHREVDDALEGREEGVDADHQGAEVGLALVGAEGGEIDLAEAGVRVDQRGVVRAMVADQEDPAHRVEVAEQVLDPLRRDGLALDVLVDLLLAVDDAEVAELVALHEVAGVEPSVGVERRRPIGRIEVADHHVGPADEHLAVLGERHLDAGQREAQGVVPVVAGRCHRDAAGGLGHAEAAHQLDTAILEEAEDLRVEVAGRRQTPAKRAAGQPARHEVELLVAGGVNVDLAADPLVELHPLHRNADEDGRPELLHLANQRLDVGALGEAVGRTPEDATGHLEEASEGVEERQVAEQPVVLADLRQRQGAGEALEDDVAVVEADALRRPGRARGVHHGGEVTEADPVTARGERLGCSLTGTREQLVEGVHPLGGSVVVEGHDGGEPRRLVAPAEHLLELLVVRDHDRVDLRVGEDVGDLGLSGSRRDHDVDDAVGEAREVAQRHLEAVLGQDRHPRSVRSGGEGEQPARNQPDPPGDLVPGDRPFAAGSGQAEQDPRAVCRRALREQPREAEVGSLDKLEDPAAPGVDRPVGGDSLAHIGAPQHVEQRPRDRLLVLTVAREAFRAPGRHEVERGEAEVVEDRVGDRLILEELNEGVVEGASHLGLGGVGDLPLDLPRSLGGRQVSQNEEGVGRLSGSFGFHPDGPSPQCATTRRATQPSW